MKKTIIAAAIASVVAAPAMADVSISGSVEQAFTETDTDTGATSITDELVGSNDVNLVFKASEDLGNGMSAFAKIHLNVDADNSKDEIVGLKGGFGTIIAGKFEDFTESKLMSRATFEGDASVDGGALENGALNTVLQNAAANASVGAQLTSAIAAAPALTNAGRTDHGLAYVSPTVNGLHFGIGGYAINNAANSWNDDSFDAVDIALFYDNGPLSMAVSHEDLNFGGTSSDQESTTATVSYSMGDLKATYLRQDIDDVLGVANLDTEANIYRLDYSMGNNTLRVGYNDSEIASGTASLDSDVTSVELVHNMSKRTSVYFNYTDAGVDQSIYDADWTTVGLKHSF